MTKLATGPQLTRDGMQSALDGKRIDLAKAISALQNELGSGPARAKVAAFVSNAAKSLSSDGYVSAHEARTLFDGLKGFDPHSSNPALLTLSKPGAPELAMLKIMRALDAATVDDPSTHANTAELVVSTLPGPLRAKAALAVPLILEAAKSLSLDEQAYVLATARHESRMGNDVQEWASGSQYEGRADLGNTQVGDGVRFKGRGFVHITGRKNYTDWSQRLGLDLLGKPSIAEQPEIAARILVEGMQKGTFTGWRLADFAGPGGFDFVQARRIVNGLDKASTIAAFATQYRGLLAG